MNPVLILSVFLGGAAGVFVFSLFSVGLVATPSPGSIFAILALAYKGDALKILLGIVVSTIVSFVVSSFFMKRNSLSEEDFNNAKDTMKNLKQSKENNSYEHVKKIVFACDAGMGSSAMGASKFKNRLKKQGIDINVSYSSVDNIEGDTQIVVTHENLKSRVISNNKNVRVIGIQNFLNDVNIENLFNEIIEFYKSSEKSYDIKEEQNFKEHSYNNEIFNENNIILDVKVSSKV